MFNEHYLPLVIAYMVGLGGWLATCHIMPEVWPNSPAKGFDHPWKEFGIAIAGAIGVIAIGQLWSSGIRLPEKGMFGPLLGSINQILIFAPIILVLLIRRQPLSTAWLPKGHIIKRLLTGIILAILAIIVYSLLRKGSEAPWTILGRIWRYENLDKMFQVFLEDFTIAILFFRLADAIGKKWATVIVACLFAIGHIPAMLSQGATGADILSLLRDMGLGIAIILVLQRSKDIMWFWVIHFCLDMTQFAKITGVG